MQSYEATKQKPEVVERPASQPYFISRKSHGFEAPLHSFLSESQVLIEWLQEDEAAKQNPKAVRRLTTQAKI